MNEAEEMRIGKFIGRLRGEIRRKLIFTPNLTTHSAGNLAIEIERNASKKKIHSNTTYARTTRTYSPKNTSTPTAP